MSDPIFDIGRDLQRAYDEGYEQGKADAEQTNVPDTNAGDLISRQTAIIALANNRCGNDEWDLAVTHDVETVKKLPSVEPERPRGKWIDDGDGCFKCSKCNTAFCWSSIILASNYCPDCGADMRGEQALKYADNDTAFGGLQSAT